MVLDKTSVIQLKGVGSKLAENLQRMQIETVQDLLLHLPIRYQDRTRLYSIASIQAGDHVLIEGLIEQVQVTFARRANLVVTLADDTGKITLRFFHLVRPSAKICNQACAYDALVKYALGIGVV